MRISDWSSDVCSSDLGQNADRRLGRVTQVITQHHHQQCVGQSIHDDLGARLSTQRFVSKQMQQSAETGINLFCRHHDHVGQRSEEHTSELQSLMRISYAVFCLKKKKNKINK